MHTATTGVAMNHLHPDVRADGYIPSASLKQEAAAKLAEYFPAHPEPFTAVDRMGEYTAISGTLRR